MRDGLIPEVRASGEDEAVEVVGGTHGLNDDIGEGAIVEALQLDMIAEGSEVAIQCA